MSNFVVAFMPSNQPMNFLGPEVAFTLHQRLTLEHLHGLTERHHPNYW